jgi:hypothetical protein
VASLAARSCTHSRPLSSASKTTRSFNAEPITIRQCCSSASSGVYRLDGWSCNQQRTYMLPARCCILNSSSCQAHDCACHLHQMNVVAAGGTTGQGAPGATWGQQYKAFRAVCGTTVKDTYIQSRLPIFCNPSAAIYDFRSRRILHWTQCYLPVWGASGGSFDKAISGGSFNL